VKTERWIEGSLKEEEIAHFCVLTTRDEGQGKKTVKKWLDE